MKQVRVAVLYRVSTKKQLKSNNKRKNGKISPREIKPEEDLPLQRGKCEECISKHTKDGWVHAIDDSGIKLEYIEGGLSAYYTPMNRRQVLMQAIQDAKDGKYDMLLVYRLDRFGRRTEALDLAIKLIRHTRFWVADKDKEFTNNGSVEELMNFIEFWSAKKSSEDTKQRVTDAMRQLFNEGIWTGGTPSFGYEHDWESEKSNQIRIEPREAEIVRIIFDLYANEGMGVQKIAYWLNEHGYKPREAEFWQANTLSKILRNPLYKGYLSYGKTSTTEGEFGKYQRRLPEEEWLVFPHRFEDLAIISEEQWEHSQRLRKSRRIPPNDEDGKATVSREGTSMFLLHPLTYCGTCGGKLYGIVNTKKRSNGEVNHLRYYTCFNRKQSGEAVCDGDFGSGRKSIRKEQLESSVVEHIKEFCKQLADSQLLNQVNQFTATSRKTVERELEQVTKELKKQQTIETNAKRMLGDILAGEDIPFSHEYINEQLKLSKTKIMELTSKRDELWANVKQEELENDELNHLSTIIRHFGDIFDQASTQAKKEMLSKIIDRIVVKGDNITVDVNFKLAGFFEALVNANLHAEMAATNEDTQDAKQVLSECRLPWRADTVLLLKRLP